MVTLYGNESYQNDIGRELTLTKRPNDCAILGIAFYKGTYEASSRGTWIGLGYCLCGHSHDICVCFSGVTGRLNIEYDQTSFKIRGASENSIMVGRIWGIVH